MYCRKCGAKVNSVAQNCARCGVQVSDGAQGYGRSTCKCCGEPLRADANYCEKCGTGIGQVQGHTSSLIDSVSRPALGFSTHESKTIPTQPLNSAPKPSASRINKTYLWSVISAGICFVLRLIMQEEIFTRENLWENRYVLGIDSDIKPFLTVIPVIASIIVSLMITSDTVADSRKKGTAFITNAIFIALALLFIWFDIPYKIFEF